MANKPKVPLSDACEFYLLGFGTHESGCGQIKVTNRPPQFGVFFDGTGNNAANDFTQRGDREPTNVSKLHLLYPDKKEHFIGATYIPGVGTEAGHDDSDIDMAFAFGFGEKVRLAIGEVQKFFSQEQYKNAPIGILDVFGFSRGAAAARHFVNEVHRLNKIFPKHFGGAQLQVRFLGLFDTVGSVGMAGDNSQKLFFTSESFVFDVNPKAVHHAYHLTAHHEQREYFPLSSILTGPGQSPAPHFEEKELPGAHSDVGGGYGTKPDMVYYPEDSFGWNMNYQREQKLKEFKAQYEKQYHVPGININMKARDEGLPTGVITRVAPEWNRFVKPQLAHSALSKMHTRACEKGVPFEPLETLMKKQGFLHRQTKDVYDIPADLQGHLEQLETTPKKTWVEDYVFQNYIHHSHQYRAIPKRWAVVVFNSNAPKTNPKLAAPNGKREIFYNEIAKGYSSVDTWERKHVTRTGGIWKRK